MNLWQKRNVLKQYDSYQNLETLKNLDGNSVVSKKNADITVIRVDYNACKQFNIKFKVTCHKLIGKNLI